MRVKRIAALVTLGLVALVGCGVTAEGDTFTAQGSVLGLDANLNPAGFFFNAL
jgi:hypothetical protein